MAVLRRIHLHALGRAHHALCQLLDARRKGGAEHHRLRACAGELVDLGQIVRETEVEHAVALVHHQKAYLIEFDLARALQIQQASRRCDHQIGVLQLGQLHGVGHTADDVGDAQAAAMPHHVDGVMRDLLRQFARRAQHKRARRGGLEVARIGGVLTARTFRWCLAAGKSLCGRLLEVGFGARLGQDLVTQESVQHRQQVGSGLAAARLAGHHQVLKYALRATLAAQGHGNDL